MKISLESFLKHYRTATDGRPVILNRPDIREVCAAWPWVENVLAGIVDICGPCLIAVERIESESSPKKELLEFLESKKETCGIFLKMAAAYNYYHARRVKGDAFMRDGSRGDVERFRPLYDEIKSMEEAARRVLDALNFQTSLFYHEEADGMLKIYDQSSSGCVEIVPPKYDLKEKRTRERLRA